MMLALHVQSQWIPESYFCLFIRLGDTLSTDVTNKTEFHLYDLRDK